MTKRFRLGYVCGDYGLIDNAQSRGNQWIDLHSMSENSEKNVQICINKMNELAEENEQLKSDLIDHSALISMLEDYQALKIEDTLYNLTGAKSEEEFNELYKPYLEKAKRCWR